MKSESAEMCRCPWVDLSKADYMAYHDDEWGVPVHDDRLQFEFLTLESAQAGLNWYTVLKKRENYRAAFDDFDPEKVAAYDDMQAVGMVNDHSMACYRRQEMNKPDFNACLGS